MGENIKEENTNKSKKKEKIKPTKVKLNRDILY